MKKLASLSLSLFLFTGMAFAETPKTQNPQTNTAPRPKKSRTVKPAGKTQAQVDAEIDEIRQAMKAQQEQLQLLKEELAKRDRQIDEARDAAAAANTHAAEATAKASEAESKASEAINSQPAAATAAANAATADVVARVAKNEKEIATSKKEFGDKIKAFGPFSYSGDFRLRDEPFFGGPVDHSQVRNRERFRLRFNANAKLNDDISGGFSLATGDVNDPISTNQTTNQFYTRKIFAVDRAFITYNPHQFKPLLLTGGKFAYPFYRTELTWDNDLNPEGAAQTLQWNSESSPLRRIAVVGFELPFAEVAGVSTKSIVQSAVYGGQLQTVWQLGSWLKFSAYGAFYNYHNADPIALALATANAKNPQSPLLGLLPLGGSSVQNSVTTTTATGQVTIPPTPPSTTPTVISTGVKTITNAQFASKFGLFDGIARFDIKTGMPRLPLVVLGDYVQNTRACGNVDNILAVPAATATAVFSQKTNAPCNSRERRGYWLEGRVGRIEQQGDLQLAYTRMFIEREAVMGAFNFSDLRQNSNVSQHRVEVFYQAYKNVQLAFTGLIGRPLNFGKATPPEPWLKRFQFDVVYKF